MYIPTTTLTQGGTPVLHGCRVYNSTTQSVNSGSDAQPTFDSEIFDTDGYHSTVSATSRITIPAGLGGYYLIIGQVMFAAAATGQRSSRLLVNGASTIGVSIDSSADSAQPTTHILSSVFVLTASQYVEMNVFQNSGGPLNIGSAQDYHQTALSVVLLGT